MKMEPTILVNDPSMTAWGYAVIEQGRVIVSGCIKTEPDYKKKRIRKSDDLTRRVSEIVHCLEDIIDEHGVNYIISELPHGSQNAQAAVMIGVVVGIVQTFADLYNYPIEWYSEMDAKKALLGKKSATKAETINKIIQVYNWTPTGTKYRDEAVADALAVYYVATQQSPVLKFYGQRHL